MCYIAFVLDDVSKQKLLTKYKPQHPKVYADLITLRHGVAESELDSVKEEFGDFNFVRVCGYGSDRSTDCVGVITDTGVYERRNGTRLHVTISVAEDAEPVLATHTAEKITKSYGSFILTGSIQFCQ